MTSEMVVYLAFHVLPALAIAALARPMIASNARAYPRFYSPFVQKLTLLIGYVCAVCWIAVGLRFLISP